MTTLHSSKYCCHCSYDTASPVGSSKKSNISAERLTLLPGFLSKGVKTCSTPPDSDNDSPLNPPKIRRSWRHCDKKHPETVSGYFSNLPESREKSIFKDIKQRVKEEDSVFDEGFLENLKHFHLRDSEHYRAKIKEEVQHINNALTGKGKNMSINRKRGYNEEEKENYPKKFPYVPPSNWVFQTPPNRKLNFNHVKMTENAIRPAIIESRNEKKVVYEMNTKINVDLTHCGNKQEVNIDKRYMMEAQSNFEEQDDEKMEIVSTDLELENHFLSLTCRPKKVFPTLPRLTTIKRKRDIFEPQAGCSTEEDYKPNVCFLENLNNLEESFTFKFSNDGVEGSTTGHLFDYEGKKKNSFNLRL